MRWCPVCADDMSPEFASACEDPIAWSCPACGFLQLETGGRALSDEQLAVVREIGRPRQTVERSAPREGAAAGPVRAAREVLAAFGLSAPVDVERVAALLGYPLEWVARTGEERGGLSRRESAQVLLLNRNYPFRSEAERRWVIAEELGHAVLGHRALAASDEPGRPHRLREPERHSEETEARAFAAELLMPGAEVRAAFRRTRPQVAGAAGRGERAETVGRVVAALAAAFEVSQPAMRVRLEELDLLH